MSRAFAAAPGDANAGMVYLRSEVMRMHMHGWLRTGALAGLIVTLAIGGATEAVGQEVKSAKDEFDVQLEDLLGKDGMTRLSDYERTMGERMQLQQYQQAFNASGAALNDQQSQGLLGIMKEERMKQPPSPLDPGKADVGAAMKALQSDDTFDTLMASQEDMNRRVLSRARNVLTPDQMVQFETIQKQQLDMQKMGMKMGREMMKAK